MAELTVNKEYNLSLSQQELDVLIALFGNNIIGNGKARDITDHIWQKIKSHRVKDYGGRLFEGRISDKGATL